MMERLKRETEMQQMAADDERLAPLRATATAASYRAYLSRIYGFDAPVEAAFASTTGFGELIDMGWRKQVRLLKSDLAALGVIDPTTLPTCPELRFSSVVEALGWLYVVEYSAIYYGQLRRHFERWLPQQLSAGGFYLLGRERAAGTRFSELGAALDGYARKPEMVTKIVGGARQAFRRQHLWFAHGTASRGLAELAP